MLLLRTLNFGENYGNKEQRIPTLTKIALDEKEENPST